jgi:hypothetical protein
MKSKYFPGLSIVTLVIHLAFHGATASLAADDTSMRYGSGGCGLGAAIIGSGEGFGQVFAVTTNATFYTQLFGITSGTSNCVPHAGSKNATAFLNQFLTVNNVAFAEDVARGHGEALEVVAQELGCEDPEVFGSQLQAHFAEIYPSHQTQGTSASLNLVSLLKAQQVGTQCRVVL